MQESRERLKRERLEAFNNSSEDIAQVWTCNCNKCLHRYICKDNHNGYFCKSFIDVAEHDKALTEELITRIIGKFEKIDRCEWAMFSLCLVKEVLEDVKKGK